MDLEAPLHISELNSAILFLSLKNVIALFSSEMCRGASKSTSHPQTMKYVQKRCDVYTFDICGEETDAPSRLSCYSK